MEDPGRAVLLAEIDLTSFSGTAIETEVFAVAGDSGTVNGFMFFFETELSPGNWLSTHPRRVSGDTSWRSLVQILPVAFDVNPGDALWVKYQYRASDEVSWVAVEPAKAPV